jgi:alpha/beta hydrolase family protein
MRIKRRQFLQVAAASGGAALLSPTKAIADQQFLTSAPLGSFKMFYEVHGDGPAVIFAHGSRGTHVSWWQQVPVLSKQYRCVTIDHRGFGYSKDQPNKPGRQNFVSDLADPRAVHCRRTGSIDPAGSDRGDAQRDAWIGARKGGGRRPFGVLRETGRIQPPAERFSVTARANVAFASQDQRNVRTRPVATRSSCPEDMIRASNSPRIAQRSLSG